VGDNWLQKKPAWSSFLWLDFFLLWMSGCRLGWNFCVSENSFVLCGPPLPAGKARGGERGGPIFLPRKPSVIQ
jgi:hypothetical protein